MPEQFSIQKKTLLRPDLNPNGKRPILIESNNQPDQHQSGDQDEKLPFDILLGFNKRSRISQNGLQPPSSLRASFPNPTPPTQSSSSNTRHLHHSLLPPTPLGTDSQRRSLLPPPKPSRPTTPTPHHLPPPTFVLDKETRLAREKQRNKEELKRETLQWQEKYRVAIKSFVFYLDRLDTNVSLDLTDKLECWGARVDQFFSKDVTHVITDTPVPANLPGPSPTAQASSKRLNLTTMATTPYALTLLSPSGHNKENVLTRRGAAAAAAKKATMSPEKESLLYTDASQQHQQQMPIDPLMRKALEMKIKIWRTEKLLNVLYRLQDHRSPLKPIPATKPSLPSLLLKEQQQGHTAERDPIAARPDFHYFAPKSYFILVEDSLSEHKPVHVKEYPKPKTRETVPWPILHGGTEGKSAFSKYGFKHSLSNVQSRIRQMLEERVREAPIIIVPPSPPPPQQPPPKQKQEIRRAKSMNILQRRQSTRLQLQQNRKPDENLDLLNLTAPVHHRGPGKVFLAASGNSVNTTSNPAPSTTTTRSSLPNQSLNNKRLIELVKRPTIQMKRVQSLDGAMMKKEKEKLNNEENDKHQNYNRSRKGLGVRAKLGIGIDLINLKSMAIIDEPKPGYCENCRQKYTDFKRHVIGKRHRKFATNTDNWWELDQLLNKTTRKLKPGVTVPPSLRKLIGVNETVEDYEDEEEEVEEEEEEEEEEGVGEEAVRNDVYQIYGPPLDEEEGLDDDGDAEMQYSYCEEF